MVERDGAQHGDVAANEVRRVPTPAHPDLEHTDRYRLVCEPEVGEGREGFEVGDLLVGLCVDGQQVGKEMPVLLGELIVSDRFAADGETLGDRREVG